ncbi:TPA: hypothetical protein U9I93_003951 [Acinetobacter baumannii]|nr:hypothetical protein [Acinetobacter baumannii]HEN9537584.1 hypothetical protein [Acinetobacter baumannii]
MDNYKIKVKDEAESKEAQELFFELGFRWKWTQDKEVLRESTPYLFTLGVNIGYGLSLTKFDECVGKELTLPQLRDLVVLKRNDVKDATHEDQYGDKWLYLDERHYVYLNYQWSLPTGEFLERYELKPIEKSQPQDPALISGAEALRALADGKDVQWATGDEFQDVTGQWEIREFSHPSFRFRIKPQTIKVELELPKPFEPKEGDEYFYISTLQHCLYSHDVWSDEPADITQAAFGAYKTEDDVKKAVEQLRKIRGAS